MMLSIDIGNTTIAIAVMNKMKVTSITRLDTNLSVHRLKAELKNTLLSIAKKYKSINVAVVCSVVPNKTIVVAHEIHNVLNLKAKIIGQDIMVPMKNKYRNPKQVGQDRLVGAYAAMKLYGNPVIVIDLGTAITFDIVSPKKEYLGGVIVPGIRLSAESLFLKTALLPKINIKAPKNVIGRTTEESILSGLFYGYGSLCQGLIELISKQMGGCPNVVMTGGHTHLMKRFVASKIRIIDDNLVHKGMALLHLEC